MTVNIDRRRTDPHVLPKAEDQEDGFARMFSIGNGEGLGGNAQSWSQWYMNQGTATDRKGRTGNQLMNLYLSSPVGFQIFLSWMAKNANKAYDKVDYDGATVEGGHVWSNLFSWALTTIGLSREDFANAVGKIRNSYESYKILKYEEHSGLKEDWQELTIKESDISVEVVAFTTMMGYINKESAKLITEWIQRKENGDNGNAFSVPQKEIAAASQPLKFSEKRFTEQLNTIQDSKSTLIKLIAGGPTGISDSAYKQGLTDISSWGSSQIMERVNWTEDWSKRYSRNMDVNTSEVATPTSKNTVGNQAPSLFQRIERNDKPINHESEMIQACCSILLMLVGKHADAGWWNGIPTKTTRKKNGNTSKILAPNEINAQHIEDAIRQGFLIAGCLDFKEMMGEKIGIYSSQQQPHHIINGKDIRFEIMRKHVELMESIDLKEYAPPMTLIANENNNTMHDVLLADSIEDTIEYRAVKSFLKNVPYVIVMVANRGSQKWESAAADFNSTMKKNLKGLADIAGATSAYGQGLQGIEAKKEEIQKNLFQCILLAAMPTLEKISYGIRSTKVKPTMMPWGGRILPLSIKPYQNSINALTLPPVSQFETNSGIQEYLNSNATFGKQYSTFVSLSKVVKNFKDLDDKLVSDGNEIKLPLMFAFAELVKNEKGVNIGKSIFMRNAEGKIKEGPLYKDNLILIKSINIDFKGGNMATAKSDVEVKMSFLLPDIRFLDQTFEDTVNIRGKSYRYKYSFMDLITYTNNNKTTGFASIFKNQYHPDYNRLLLESFVYYKMPLNNNSVPETAKHMNKTLKNVPLVLDIAVVDHQIKKDSKTNQAEITINYRGYIDSAMSDPSYDALAGPRTVDGRVKREIDLQKKLKDGCTLAEIRTAINKYRSNLFSESFTTLSRISDVLSTTNRLFTINVPRDKITESLNATDSAIDKPYIINDSLKNINIAALTKGWAEINRQIQNSSLNSNKKDIIQIIDTAAKQLDLAEWFSSRVDYGDLFKSWYVISSDSKNGELTKHGKKKAEAAKKRNIYQKLGQPISFFFFGDLVDILLDGIHAYPMSGTSYSRQKVFRTEPDLMYEASGIQAGEYYFKPDPIKVILCSFDWYVPKAAGGERKYTTNLADVPISMEWFAEWFRLEIIEKNLNYYPISAFIKKLATTVITRILGEVCFDVASDKKVLFRAQTDIGLFDEDLATSMANRNKNVPQLFKNYFNHLKSGKDHFIQKGTYTLNYDYSSHRKLFPLLKKSGAGKTVNDYQRHDYCSYLIIYPANASSYEMQAKSNNQSSKDAGIPELNYKAVSTTYTAGGFQHQNSNVMLSSMDFSKQDAPYRREVKFFASNQGNYAQISGVYNVKVKIAKAAYFFYPGQLIWVDAGLGDSPQNIESMAFVLGIGGYYQIISVNHRIEYYGGSSPNSTTMIEAAWVAYGIDQQGKGAKYAYYKPSFISGKSAQTNKSCDSLVPSSRPTNFRIPKPLQPPPPPEQPPQNPPSSEVPNSQPVTNNNAEQVRLPMDGEQLELHLVLGGAPARTTVQVESRTATGGIYRPENGNGMEYDYDGFITTAPRNELINEDDEGEPIVVYYNLGEMVAAHYQSTPQTNLLQQ